MTDLHTPLSPAAPPAPPRRTGPSSSAGDAGTPLMLAVTISIVVLGAGAAGGQLGAAATSLAVQIILVIGLYLFTGNSGVLGLGHVAFMALGAYVAGFLTIPAVARPLVLSGVPETWRSLTAPFGLATLAAALVSAIVAALVFLPLRRLGGLALSIAMLSLLLIAQAVLLNASFSPSGGTLTRVPLDQDGVTVLPWTLAAVVIAYVYQSSPAGLRLRATREDEFAARSAGIDIGWARFGAFVLSAAVTGAGGALFGHTLGSFGAKDFSLAQTVLLVTMLVVGGFRSLTGAVTGAVLVSALSVTVGEFEAGVSLGATTVHLPPGSRAVAVALLMLIALVARPDGLLGGREVRLPRRRVAPRAVARDDRPTPTSDSAPRDDH